MPEIDNSLAASIKPLDVGGALAKAAQLREATAKADLAQQAYQHNEREYGENAGLTSGERATMSKTQQEAMGPIGNILSNDQSPQARQQAISLAKRAGIPMDDMTAGHLMSAPPEQVKQYGMNAQRLGQSSSSNIEQNPNAIAQRAQSHAGGAKVGEFRGPPGYQGAPQAPTAPGEPAPPDVPLAEQAAGAAESARISGEQLRKHATTSEAAANQKVALRDLMLKAEDVRTGKYAGKEQEARKIFQAAAEYFPTLKKYSPDKAIAAFESINKDQGLVAREAMKGVGGTAASELSAVTESLVGGGTSHGGIINNGSQLIGLKNAEIAKNVAAQDYFQKYGSLKGFDANFTKNAGPAAWVYMALPPEEQDHIRDSLKKSKAGEATFNSIIRQMHYIHKNKLDEGLE